MIDLMLTQPTKKGISNIEVVFPLQVNFASIVIPAYNEEKRISQTIKDLVENMPEISELIVISDGTDGTAKIAKKISEKVKVIEYARRLGQGGAVIEGFRQAKGDVVCFIDADGAAPWYEVNRICSLVNDESPVVYGSRWVEGAKIGKKERLRNIVGGRIYHYLAFLILGVKEKDSFCGLKAFKRDIALELCKRVTLTDRTFNIGISYNLKLMGIDIKEVGIEWSHRDGTQLHVSLKVVIVMFLTLIGLRLAHCKNCNRFKKVILRLRQKIYFY